MRFKKPKSLRHRHRSDEPPQATESFQGSCLNLDAAVEDLWSIISKDPRRAFTYVLNTALATVIESQTLPDEWAVLAWTWMNSWGNWSPYAVKKEGRIRFMDVPEDLRESELFKQTLAKLILGPGPCPMCHKPANEEHPFRWHTRCVARAFARDAARFGNPKERAWAEELLGTTP